MQRDTDYDERDVIEEEEEYSDSFLNNISNKIKNRRVPANKKKPIHCDNVEVGFNEFNPDNYVCVLELKEVSQNETNEP